MGISGEEARGLQVTWAWPGFEPTHRAKLAAQTASGRAGRAKLAAQTASGRAGRAKLAARTAGGPDGARNTGGAATRNAGGAAAMRVCERPGGESPPPGLYAQLTFP